MRDTWRRDALVAFGPAAVILAVLLVIVWRVT